MNRAPQGIGERAGQRAAQAFLMGNAQTIRRGGLVLLTKPEFASFVQLAGDEAWIEHDREISVVACRAADGTFVAYDPPENDHSGGILRRSVFPSTAPKAG